MKPLIQVRLHDQDGFARLVRRQITPLDRPVDGVIAALDQLGRFFNRDGRVANHGRIPVGPHGGFLREYPIPKSPC